MYVEYVGRLSGSTRSKVGGGWSWEEPETPKKKKKKNNPKSNVNTSNPSPACQSFPVPFLYGKKEGKKKKKKAEHWTHNAPQRRKTGQNFFVEENPPFPSVWIFPTPKISKLYGEATGSVVLPEILRMYMNGGVSPHRRLLVAKLNGI